MASPHPLPTATKQLRGNPGKRALNKNEPKPSTELPPPPACLTPAARIEWDNLVPELNRIGILTSIDINSFTRYCLNLAEWKECVQFLADKVVGVMPFPHTKRKREYEVLLLTYEREFGMTPSSRSKVTVAPKQQHQEIDDVKAAVQQARMRLAQ